MSNRKDVTAYHLSRSSLQWPCNCILKHNNNHIFTSLKVEYTITSHVTVYSEKLHKSHKIDLQKLLGPCRSSKLDDRHQCLQPCGKSNLQSHKRIGEKNCMKDDIGKTLSLLANMKSNDPAMNIRFPLHNEGRIKSMLWCTRKNRMDYIRYPFWRHGYIWHNLPDKFIQPTIQYFYGCQWPFQIFYIRWSSTNKREDFEWTFSTFLDIMSNAAPKTILTGTSFLLS